MKPYACGGETGLRFMKDVGKPLIEQSGDKRASALLFQSTSLAVPRGNAITIFGTMETEAETMEKIFLL